MAVIERMREAVLLTPEGVRAELAGWVTGHGDPSMPLLEWRTLLASSGWATPSWPERWHGKGWPAWTDAVVAEALVDLGTVGVPLGLGMQLAAPTILEHGTDDLRRRYLLPTIRGEITWCQLFSEPGAGSDLAGATTTAVRDGDEWIVNGQKVWNTGAHYADMGILVARTDWDVAKHAGLSFFVIDMRQPGVTVRPLRQMNHHQSFNEVFLDDARVPARDQVGALGEGWHVALTTLSYERKYGGRVRPNLSSAPGRLLDEARAEVEHYFESYRWYPQRSGRVDLVVDRARENGVDQEPVVRQEIARLLSLQMVSQWTASRASAARALGRTPGAEGSVGKLASSEISRSAARVHSLIGGASGLLRGSDAPLDGVIAEVLVSTPGQSIAGGTDEIQKNILGEKMLGLPREPSPEFGEPFRLARRNG